MNTLTKRLLSLSLLAAIAGPGVVLAQSNGVAPHSLLSSQPQNGQQAVQPVAIPPSHGAPPATSAGPEIVVPAAPVSTPEADRLRAQAEAQAARISQLTAAGADESLLMRESARLTAQLQMLNAASKIEEAQQQMASRRTKFQLEQARTEGEISTLKTPSSTLGVGAVGASGVAGVISPELMATPSYYFLGISSFAGRTIAEIKSDDFGTVMVEKGATLPDGAKLLSLSETNVVIMKKGKRHTIYMGVGPQKPVGPDGKPLETLSK